MALIHNDDDDDNNDDENGSNVKIQGVWNYLKYIFRLNPLFLITSKAYKYKGKSVEEENCWVKPSNHAIVSREHKESASIVEREREKIIYFAKREKSRKWSTQCTYFVCLGTVIIHSNGDSDKSVRTERKFFYFICQNG